jgi:hypothetical protein
MPSSSMVYDPDNPNGDDVEFLGHNITPSGISIEQNAYILNIQTPDGGYIDGMALDMIDGQHVSIREYTLSHTSFHAQRKTRFDTNPSCCGHLINHSKIYQNVQIYPFLWTDVLIPIQNNVGYNINKKIVYHKKDISSLPNTMRQDGAPRYMFNGDVIRYASINDTISRVERVYGAVIYATMNLEPNQELLMDYGLSQSPLPKWAASWYNKAL